MTQSQYLAFYEEAFKEAQLGISEGGIPIGAILVFEGKIIGRGHNRRVQEGSVIKHGEMDCLENGGRYPAGIYQKSILYTTLSPCDMCAGAILLYKIPRVVIGENTNFMGNERLLKDRGIEIIHLNHGRTIEMMSRFIQDNPHLWNEDIGESHA